MLPTTGHFKNISCPFYDACICERPYCHFKHTKREPVNDTNLISELVSKAVHKVLNSNSSTPSEVNEKTQTVPTGDGKAITYNPTPISELNKIKSTSTSAVAVAVAVPKDLPEKRNRHIPIQYTPEQPRSFRSVSSSNYNPSPEFIKIHDENKGGIVAAATAPSNKSTPVSVSVSYIPSSIKTLAADQCEREREPSNYSTNNSISSSSSPLPLNSHQYVPLPFNITSEDSQLTAEYNPTKNLSLVDNVPTYNEYVPNYADDFIDEFIHDSNIYEPTEIIPNINTDTLQIKTTTTQSTNAKKVHKGRSTSSSTKANANKEKNESKKRSEKDKNKSKSSQPNSSTHSKSSNKTSNSKHKSGKKECDGTESEKQQNGHGNRRDKQHTHTHTHTQDKQRDKSRSRKKTRERTRSRSRDKDKKRTQTPTPSKDKAAATKSSDKRDNISLLNSNKHHIDVASSKEESADDDSIHSVSLDFPEEFSESDDELEQCKRIFEEYQPPAENTQIKIHPKPGSVINDSSNIEKKRVAHENSQNIARKPVVKAPPVKSAALVMLNRYKQIKASTVDKITINVQNSEAQDRISVNPTTQIFKRPLSKLTDKYSNDSTNDISYPPAKIKRIAHVPNVSSLLNAKKKVEEIAKNKQILKTPIQTVAKGSKRIAHTPEMNIADVPPVLQSEKSKLPVNVRNRYLFLMVKECIKLYVSKQAAYDRALNEELNCYSKCSAITTYRNSVMLSINRLRKEAEMGVISAAHKDPLDSTFNLDDAVRIPNHDINDSMFTGRNLYMNIAKWILSEEVLFDNGFPRPGANKKGHALFKETKQIEKVPEGNELCVRCRKIYKVEETGAQTYEEDCIHHPGKRFYTRGEAKYLCCKESVASSGCCVGSKHVFEIRDPVHLSGFVTTFEPYRSNDDRCHAVYALDCEMVYTTKGIELARVTVINEKLDVVYESLVKPMGCIIDCNTRFSGLTLDMLEHVNTRITDVQATLLHLFNSKTILIGHSLESDLKCLRLIHNTVIDTSILFPHHMGPPRKRALKALASEFLRKIIQDNEGGHDSAEDAIACMELVMWRLKDDMKLR